MTRAIILAAGKGTRLVDADEPPKPLQRVEGAPLIHRVIDSLTLGGVREIAVVVGYRGTEIRDALERRTDVEIELVWNEAFEKPNGTSMLHAAHFVQGPTWLTMSDHLWSPQLMQRVRTHATGDDEAVLGVDRRIGECFDLDDATKVKLEGDRIRAIGKSLEDYDALDTGVFRIGPSFVDSLRAVDGPAGCSLSQGVAELARRDAMRAADVGDATWVDVDTRQALEHAESLIRRGSL